VSVEQQAEARRAWPVVPWALLTLFLLLMNGATVLCSFAEISIPPAAAYLFPLAAIPVFWGLVEAECRPHKVTFPIDAGYFLYVTGWLLVPYYLWRAQRGRGLLKTLLIVAIWLGTYAFWVGVSWVLQHR
jgi:hypothetical protein